MLLKIITDIYLSRCRLIRVNYAKDLYMKIVKKSTFGAKAFSNYGLKATKRPMESLFSKYIGTTTTILHHNKKSLLINY